MVSGADIAAAEASAVLLLGSYAKLAVAGTGDGACRPLAGSGAYAGGVQALAGCYLASEGQGVLCYGVRALEFPIRFWRGLLNEQNQT